MSQSDRANRRERERREAGEKSKRAAERREKREARERQRRRGKEEERERGEGRRGERRERASKEALRNLCKSNDYMRLSKPPTGGVSARTYKTVPRSSGCAKIASPEACMPGAEAHRAFCAGVHPAVAA